MEKPLLLDSMNNRILRRKRLTWMNNHTINFIYLIIWNFFILFFLILKSKVFCCHMVFLVVIYYLNCKMFLKYIPQTPYLCPVPLAPISSYTSKFVEHRLLNIHQLNLFQTNFITYNDLLSSPSSSFFFRKSSDVHPGLLRSPVQL